MTQSHPTTAFSAESPLAWLDLLEPCIIDKTAVPFVSSPELFSMQEMNNRLGSLFHLSGGQLSLGAPQKMEKASSLPDPLAISYAYRIGILPGMLYWVMHRDEAERLITLLLKGKQDLVPELDPDLVDAFMRYLSLEALLHLRALGFNDRLLVESIGPAHPPTEGPFLRLPLSWNIQNALFTSTLIIPDTFIDHWNRYFQQEHERKPLSDSLAKQVFLTIHLDIGMLTLTQQEWEETKVGDFLLLDQCTLVPGKDKGRVRLSTSNIPLFRAMVKEETIKLLEPSVYQEMEPSMSQKLPDSKPPAQSKPQTNPPKQPSNEEENEESEEELSEEEWEEESEWEESEEESEEELSEEESEENTLPPPGQPPQKPPAQSTPPQAKLKPAQGEKTELQTEESLTLIEQIPFTLTVEVGRIKMSLAELRQLAPGQVLDLTINPEKIDLVVEGRTIGRGELLRLGESVGVRVTEIG